MKLTTILIFCMFFGKIYGQQFAPNSAVWNYTYNYSLGTHIGYYKFTIIGDTLYKVKVAKLLKKEILVLTLLIKRIIITLME